MRRADLHAHTYHSDGRLAPADLVARARERGLHAIAVTDHDCIDGLEEAQAAGRLHNVEVVTCVELSVTVDAEEVHLLGYFFDPGHRGLNEHLLNFLTERRRRVERMVERLDDLGLPVSLESVEAVAAGRALGRPHVAQALVEAGYVQTVREAFDAYLNDRGPAFIPKPRFSAREALSLLHEAGGIGVLAHPGHWTSDSTLMTLIRAGLDGIETVHPSHDAMLTRYYRRIARDFALLETGGSDFHGLHADEELGRYNIPYTWVERAREAAGRVGVA